MNTWRPFGHGIFDVDRPEGRRRGQQHHAARCQRVDGLLVAVQADELPLLGHVHLLGELLREGSAGWTGAGCAKTSAMAQSFVGPLVLRACAAAPVPRPPQPTRAILMVLFSPA